MLRQQTVAQWMLKEHVDTVKGVEVKLTPVQGKKFWNVTDLHALIAALRRL